MVLVSCDQMMVCRKLLENSNSQLILKSPQRFQLIVILHPRFHQTSQKGSPPQTYRNMHWFCTLQHLKIPHQHPSTYSKSKWLFSPKLTEFFQGYSWRQHLRRWNYGLLWRGFVIHRYSCWKSLQLHQEEIRRWLLSPFQKQSRHWWHNLFIKLCAVQQFNYFIYNDQLPFLDTLISRDNERLNII